MLDQSEGSSGARPSQLDSRSRRRDLLELHLIQLRQEAFAARLEAKAARLEILLRRMSTRDDSHQSQADDATVCSDQVDIGDRPHTSDQRQAEDRAPASLPLADFPKTDFPLADFPLADSARSSTSAVPQPQATQPADAHDPRVGLPSSPAQQPPAKPTPTAQAAKPVGIDKTVRRPACATTGEAGDRPSSKATRTPKPRKKLVHPAEPLPRRRPTRSNSKTATKPQAVAISHVGTTVETKVAASSRSRPQALAWSAALHLGILVALALVTLQSQRPRDQVCLTASPQDAIPQSLETVTIESSEPTVDPSPPTLQETQVDINDQSPSQLIDVQPSSSSLSPIADPIGESLLSSSSSAAKLSAGNPDAVSAQAMTFCGVEGGGNHFVYLVDCSRSMGKAFESARAELIASINALKPEQRFYVIFFDAEPDYMGFQASEGNHRQSVPATPENKRALQRWAQTIQMDRGAAPYEPLRVALELKPDVIFMLSDGEFPQGIEDLLREHNRVNNLFGDDRARSIVHTISYHSQVGEERMRSIAAQNQGQYRHIPRPDTNPAK